MKMKALNTMVSAGALLAAAGLATGQTDVLYMGGQSSSTMHLIQGGVQINSFVNNQGSNFETALAVAGDVRTIAFQPGGPPGGQYGLNGGFLGAQYPNITNHYYLDGGTDGSKYNYAIDYSNGQGTVTQFDRNWANGVDIFNVGVNCGGITVDGSDNTLWITGIFGDSQTYHYTTGGSYLGQITTLSSSFESIAWEPSSDTLWVNSRDDGLLYQYAKNGTLLNTLNINGGGFNDNVHGIEFEMRGIPAPGAAALLGVSGLVASRRRRA
jgi:hypothetical protein